MRENEVSKVVVDIALQVHKALGPGLYEAVYQTVMPYALRKRGLQVETHVPIILEWDGMPMELGFRADLIVESCLIAQLKAIEKVAPFHKKQLLTYLRIADRRLGLLINFNTELIRDGISRIVNNLPE
ncbi:MAG: GxxExxY protein [Planctomycetota bacterium]